MEESTSFEAHLDLVQDALDRHSKSRLRSLEEREEFPAWAVIRLIERWPRVMDHFQGQAKFTSYLDRVIENLLRDYRIEKWGKWRPSQCALRLGLRALELERRVYRDRWDAKEAVEAQVHRNCPSDLEGADELRQELWSMLSELPRRDSIPIQLDPDLIQNWVADDRREEPEDEEERTQGQQRLGLLLVRALRELDESARGLLESYFVSGKPYVETATEQGRERTDVYNQAHRSLRRMRRFFEREGLSRSEIARLLEGVDLGCSLQQVFAAAES